MYLAKKAEEIINKGNRYVPFLRYAEKCIRGNA